MSMNGELFVLTPGDTEFLHTADYDGMKGFIEKAESLDLDRMWHGVAFLMIKLGAPVDPVLWADEELGEDGGYGPMAYRSPETTKALAAYLSTVTLSQITSAVDLEELEEEGIYPRYWCEPDFEALTRQWLTELCQQLSEFYVRAAAGGFATATRIY